MIYITLNPSPLIGVMRRESIYPHRSVRSLPMSKSRLGASLMLAVLVSGAVLNLGNGLLTCHGRFVEFLLKHTRIPVEGTRVIGIFPHLGPVRIPDIPFPPPRGNPVRTILLLAASVAGLIIVHRRYPLGRNFAVFLIILLGAATIVIVFNPSFSFSSAMFCQIWLRGEILVWILLPWVSAFLFIMTQPSVLAGIAWALGLQIYIAAWSAIRLVFCLGVLHHTGILFLLLLWFCLGVLFDLVVVLLSYSLSLHHNIREFAGRRRS